VSPLLNAELLGGDREGQAIEIGEDANRVGAIDKVFDLGVRHRTGFGAHAVNVGQTQTAHPHQFDVSGRGELRQPDLWRDTFVAFAAARSDRRGIGSPLVRAAARRARLSSSFRVSRAAIAL
jgi:hypothetical protein